MAARCDSCSLFEHRQIDGGVRRFLLAEVVFLLRRREIRRR